MNCFEGIAAVVGYPFGFKEVRPDLDDQGAESQLFCLKRVWADIEFWVIGRCRRVIAKQSVSLTIPDHTIWRKKKAA